MPLGHTFKGFPIQLTFWNPKRVFSACTKLSASQHILPVLIVPPSSVSLSHPEDHKCVQTFSVVVVIKCVWLFGLNYVTTLRVFVLCGSCLQLSTSPYYDMQGKIQSLQPRWICKGKTCTKMHTIKNERMHIFRQPLQSNKCRW